MLKKPDHNSHHHHDIILIVLTEESTEDAMDAVDMLRLMFVVELRPLGEGRFSRRTGYRDLICHHGALRLGE